MWLPNIFFQPIEHKVFILLSPVINFFFFYGVMSCLRIFCLALDPKDLLSCFFPSLIALHFIFVCHPFWVNFCMRYEVWVEGVVFFFVYGYPTVPVPFVEKVILLPLNYFCTFVKNQLGSKVELFLGSLFFPLISVSPSANTTQ